MKINISIFAVWKDGRITTPREEQSLFDLNYKFYSLRMFSVPVTKRILSDNWKVVSICKDITENKFDKYTCIKQHTMKT